MRLLAGLCSAVTVYLAVGWVGGRLPDVRLRRPGRAGAPAQRWLVQAGVPLAPRQFWAGCVAFGALAYGGAVAATSTPAVAVVPALAAGLLPRVYFARARAQRLRAVQEAWPDGLREITAAVAAGMSLPQAVAAMARTGPQPLREAFARFPLQVRVLGFATALEVIREELADPTSDRILEVLIVAHERGGRVVHELLRDLAEATSTDVKTIEKIASADLEQKINARAVFVLPWLVLLSLTGRPGPFRAFYQSPGGVVVVLLAALLSLAGMWLVGRLARERTEQRVFAERGPAEPATVQPSTASGGRP